MVSDNGLSWGIRTIKDSSSAPVGIPTKTSELENDSGFITENQIPTASTYTHTQIMPNGTWIVQHNLNRYPNVTIVDSAGSVVIGDIKYIDNNTVQISFSAAFSGKAYLN